MKEENVTIQKLTSRVYLLIILTIIVFALSMLKNSINEKWARERDVVACLPDIETNYPGVYIQSAAHQINHDAKLQLFIEQYVHLTRDKQLIDFHKFVNDKPGQVSRYDTARWSNSLWQAIFMSDGPEKTLNTKLFSEANDIKNMLEREKIAIVFLINEILTLPVPAGMDTAVIVRGQYEAIYDSADQTKKSLPPEYLGHKEIRYIIRSSFPTTDTKENFQNKNGFYVVWSEETDIPLGLQTIMEKKSREKLLQSRGQ